MDCSVPKTISLITFKSVRKNNKLCETTVMERKDAILTTHTAAFLRICIIRVVFLLRPYYFT